MKRLKFTPLQRRNNGPLTKSLDLKSRPQSSKSVLKLFCSKRIDSKAHQLYAAPLFSVDNLAPEAFSEWETCRNSLCVNFPYSVEEADAILIKAFAWGSKAYWREDKHQEIPNADRIESVVSFLQNEVGIHSQDDLSKLIKSFPEVLGLEPALMANNIDQLKNRFFLKGAALANAIKRKPRALGSITDCEGCCQGNDSD